MWWDEKAYTAINFLINLLVHNMDNFDIPINTSDMDFGFPQTDISKENYYEFIKLLNIVKHIVRPITDNHHDITSNNGVFKTFYLGYSYKTQDRTIWPVLTLMYEFDRSKKEKELIWIPLEIFKENETEKSLVSALNEFMKYFGNYQRLLTFENSQKRKAEMENDFNTLKNIVKKYRLDISVEELKKNAGRI